MIYQNENFGGEFDYRSRWHDEFLMYEHLHEYSEVLFCKKGKADVVVRGKALTLSENQLIFIPPNCVHEYMCRNCEVVCAVFSNGYIPFFFHELSGRTIISEPIDVSDIPYVTSRLTDLVGENASAISGCLNLICDLVLKRSKFSDGEFLDSNLFQKVITYISEHYTEEITLKALAVRFGYNEKYLSYSLHSLTGINFRRLLSVYRVNHSKKLLSETDKSITDVAFESGFSAINSFNRVFKSITGATPLEYRKTAQI